MTAVARSEENKEGMRRFQRDETHSIFVAAVASGAGRCDSLLLDRESQGGTRVDVGFADSSMIVVTVHVSEAVYHLCVVVS
ncbi:unnamed protein product [Microthlaspi erraticum]|uniref:Uncharacterized protein n=1 Tax=Microthlaspi erraticum TaxID=1685480 RepID=A0A6D2JUG5_9BRAS|nr:unnamed protein product [Microthlaspi erraticum]